MAIPKKTAEIPSCAKIAPKEDTIWSNATRKNDEQNSNTPTFNGASEIQRKAEEKTFPINPTTAMEAQENTAGKMKLGNQAKK